MTKSRRALLAFAPAHNTLSLDGRRKKPKPLPLLERVEPAGQDRDAIEWDRRKRVFAGSTKGNRERAWKSLHGFTNAILARG